MIQFRSLIQIEIVIKEIKIVPSNRFMNWNWTLNLLFRRMTMILVGRSNECNTSDSWECTWVYEGVMSDSRVFHEGVMSDSRVLQEMGFHDYFTRVH